MFKCSTRSRECESDSAQVLHLAHAHPTTSRPAVSASPLSKEDDFPPLISLSTQKKLPSKPVCAVKTEKQFDALQEAMQKAKQEKEAEARRREQLRVEGQRRESALLAAELEAGELRRGRKGQRHSLSNCWPPRWP